MDLVSALTMAFKLKKKVRRPHYKEGQFFTVETFGPKYLVCIDQKKKYVRFKLDSITATDWEII